MKMKTKLKLFFLAILGLILIPTTNAYELGVNLNWTNANYDVEYKNAKFTLYNSSYPYIVTYPCSNSSQGSKCFSAPYYSSVIFDYSYSIHVSLDSYSFNKFFGVAYKDNWEWRDFYHSAYSDNKAVQKLFSVPSRTAFSVKMTNGKEYIMDTVYFYHNTLVFMDSRNGFTLYLNGNIKASDGVVFVDPFLKEDNLFFIRFKEKKAWSMTVSETEAWNWFFGKKSSDVLKTLKFTKSYEVREWWDSIFPINFHVWKDKQGWPWYTYQEDIEFVSPEWNAGSNNNTENNLEAYNNCLSYYWEVHNLARLWDKCSWDGKDEQAMANFLAIQHWNWEWDAPELKGNSAFLCSVFGKYKKKYKEKHAKDWWKFEQEREEYMFNPDWLVPVNRCQSLKIWEQESGNMWKDLKAFWQNFLSSIWKSIGISNWSQVSKNDYEKDMWEYMAYVRACNHKTYLPTPYDSWKTYIIGYNLFAWGDNNENVCKFAKTLEDRINKKYKNIKFNDSYKQALIESYGSWVVNSSWGLNFSKYKEIVNSLPASPYAEEWDAWIFTFLKADYKEWVDTAYSLLSKVHCWRWFWVKEWDYIVYFPLFLLLFILIRWRL